MTTASRTTAFVAGLAFTAVLFLDFCDLIFACGCRSLWLGAAEACNVHQVHGPHCPWCSYGLLGGAVPFGATVLGQAAVAYWPGEVPSYQRVVAVFLAFPVVAGLIGVLFGLASGYWID